MEAATLLIRERHMTPSFGDSFHDKKYFPNPKEEKPKSPTDKQIFIRGNKRILTHKEQNSIALGEDRSTTFR